MPGTRPLRTTNAAALKVPCPTCRGEGMIVLAAIPNGAVCAACGRIFSASRRPNAARRSFCPECGRAASARQAGEDARRRRKEVPL